MVYKPLRELKARKAKFGFAGVLHVSHLVQLGKLMEMLHNTYMPTEYIAEQVGMQGTDFRVYTDDPAIAENIRANFCEI